MYTCPICKAKYREYQSTCANCHAGIPIPNQQKLPSSLSSPPRKVSPEYEYKLRYKNNIFFKIGFSFLTIGLLIGIIFPIVGYRIHEVLFIMIGLIFLILFPSIGLTLLYKSYDNSNKILDAIQNGIQTSAEIIDMYFDNSIKMNGNFPFCIVYKFNIEKDTFVGKAYSKKAIMKAKKIGDIISVVYLKEEPNTNTIYPPF